MEDLSHINSSFSMPEIIKELVQLFSSYAQELIKSGADFSYMNMYADNFKEALQANTNLSEYDIFEVLNEACDQSWKSQMNQE